MNRIDKKFQALRAAKQPGFIAYITAGDPDLKSTPAIVAALEQSGVAMVELGIPFSDPLADGATVQAAAGRALAAGASVAGVLESIREIRKTSQIPIVLFTYLNPIYIYGYDRFHADASAAGADGLLILDLPPDEAARNSELMKSHGLLSIRLIAPTTPPERMELIAKSSPPKSPRSRNIARSQWPWASEFRLRNRPPKLPSSPTPWWSAARLCAASANTAPPKTSPKKLRLS